MQVTVIYMKRLKVGVFGAGRGVTIAKNFLMLNCDIVALCENGGEERLSLHAHKLGKNVEHYENFDEFLNCNMDAVIIANYFNEHASYAIKCLEKGIHVYCECITNGTMAEGIQLIHAAEKSDAIFMLAENYPEFKFNREMKRICDTGVIGKVLFAEGEYNHSCDPYNDTDFRKEYNYFPGHWRNFLPRTYYITHSLGPIMKITGATPKRVTAFASYSSVPDDAPSASYCGDKVAVVTTQNDDGSIFRVTGCAGFGAHDNSYRVCGTKGQIENLRGMGEKVMLRFNEWEIPEGMEEVNLYEPEWNDPDEDLIVKSGHGGGDFLTAKIFVNCIKNGTQPPFPYDVYSGVAMSSVGILAHRSMLEGGMPYDIPDFRKEEDCKKYENDYLSPFADKNSDNFIPCCSNPDYKPSDEQMQKYLDSLK